MKRQLVTVLIVGTLLSACDDGKSNPSTPTAPSLQTTAFPRTVVETGAAIQTVTMTQDPACTFNVTYTWSGLGGGPNEEVAIDLFGSGAFIAFDTNGPVSGQGGSLSYSFAVTGHGSSLNYSATGYLLHRGRVVRNSLTTSLNTITATCP
jgi:hypothetical protein